jgi:hypothetical protein
MEGVMQLPERHDNAHLDKSQAFNRFDLSVENYRFPHRPSLETIQWKRRKVLLSWRKLTFEMYFISQERKMSQLCIAVRILKSVII